ncbi:protein phosphatase 1B-like isoform X2 [Cimex lectularius]|uniref:PPM-type phosphatase domain-containing protein n=1 Tax=Cimex lectularius TaxID=79782 RepID=A0A8I6RJD7_CIMLE|nr:protein phosphatase 1B-like isoform X2 [Cimex lectularius]
MGTFLDKPKTDKHNEHGCGNGLRYGVASMQGWRVEMEDAHHVRTGLGEKLDDWSFFAVFDGHAGATVSAHCANELLECIVSSDEFKQSEITEGIRTGFLKLDNSLRAKPEFACGQDKAGSTAVCALVSPRQVYIANCGDSRAVICRSGVPSFSTRDHKPMLPSEKERITKAGGTVMIQRVNGSLAVSRALGDYEYKNVEGRGPCEQLVSPEPEVFIQDRDAENDEFMVLACDGIWDVMSNEDLCKYVRSLLLLTDDLESVTNQVIDTCLYKGSRDNMSIVLVIFPGAPKPSPEAIEKDHALNLKLERMVREIIGNKVDMDFSILLAHLSEECIPDLPPGGGLSAKRSLIEAVYKETCPQNADTMD